MTEPIHFEGRDLPPFGEYVAAKDLVVGTVYFRAAFLDQERLVPELTPLVFVGRDLDPEQITAGTRQLFFQDYGSYVRGARWGMEPPPVDASTEIERFEQFMSRGWFETIDEKETSGVLVFEKALEILLHCSLRRRDRHQ